MKNNYFFLSCMVVGVQLCLFWSFIFAQNKESNIWYFGDKVGMTFNGGSPTLLTNSEMTTTTGSTSVSDSLGNLLFYTNGQTVWNKNHQVMLHGTGLNGNTDITHSSVIVPHPGNRHQYYIFTLKEVNQNLGTSRNALYHSIVDMNLNNGLGAVIAKNIMHVRWGNSPVGWKNAIYSEKMTVVPHSNGREYWLVLRDGAKNQDAVHVWSSLRFAALHITCKTLPVTPDYVNGVLSWISSPDNNNINYSIGGCPSESACETSGESYGQMVVSPYKEGTFQYIASASGTTGVQIFRINTATGNIFPYKKIGTLNGQGNQSGIYGVEFSPDGKRLFCTQHGNVSEIWEYNVFENGSTRIATNLGANGPASLRRGSDGKIYVALDGHNYLGVINNPNGWGTSQVNFQKNGLYLGGKKSTKGLPSPTVPSIGHFDMNISGIGGAVCSPGEDRKATFDYIGRPLSQLGNNATLTWNFGEGGAMSNLPSVTHTYNNDGIKLITLIRFDGVCSDTIQSLITINSNSQNEPSFIQRPDITICQGDTITLKAHGVQYDYNLYNWGSCADVNWGQSCYQVELGPVPPPPCMNPPCPPPPTYPAGSNLPLSSNVNNTGIYASPYKADSLVVSPSSTRSYRLSILKPIGDNLIQNGQFENGNNDFFSFYTYKNYPSPLTTTNDVVSGLGLVGTRGSYTVGHDPSNQNGSYSNCPDKSSVPTGKMMIVRGDCYTKYPEANQKTAPVRNVWQQTVDGLEPNTTYIFSAWVARATTSDAISPPIQVGIYAGAGNAGNSAWITGSTCEWQKITYLYTTGMSETSKEFSIRELAGVAYNCTGSNRGFVIDQIELYKACRYVQQTNVYVKPKPNVNAVAVAATCTGLDLGVATATPSGGTPPYTFGWSNGETTATATALPVGTNTVTVMDAFCMNDKTVTISSVAPPNLQINGTPCNNTTYDVQWQSSATNVESTAGTVSGNSVIGIPTNTDVTITAFNGNCKVSAIVVAPPCPIPPACELPSIITNAGVCDGSGTYSVSFSVTPSDAPVSFSEGTLNGNFITGIPIGTDLTITAGTGTCQTSVTRVSPPGCIDPCLLNDLFILNGTECSGSVYTAHFIPILPGLNFTSSAGMVSGNSLINIPIGTSPNLTATNPACLSQTQTEVINDPNCVACVDPQLILSAPSMCGVGTYSIYAYSDGNMTTSAGTIIGDSIIGIPLLTNIVVTATSGNCSVSSTVNGLTACPPTTDCTLPSLTTSDAVCNGSTYSLAFVVYPPQNVQTNLGTVGVGVITNIPIGQSVTLTAGSGSCAVSITRTSPTSCDYPCWNTTPLIGVGGTSCLGTTYSVHFYTASGITVTPSAGVLSGNSVINIPLGTNVILTATASCGSQTISVNSPVGCVPCTEPQLTLNAPTSCSGSTYSVYAISNGTLTSSAGNRRFYCKYSDWHKRNCNGNRWSMLN